MSWLNCCSEYGRRLDQGKQRLWPCPVISTRTRRSWRSTVQSPLDCLPQPMFQLLRRLLHCRTRREENCELISTLLILWWRRSFHSSRTRSTLALRTSKKMQVKKFIATLYDVNDDQNLIWPNKLRSAWTFEWTTKKPYFNHWACVWTS